MEVYESAENFINNLILHCPDENFKMVRYYGFYSNRNKKYIRNLKERKKI
ncbi:MAG: transposase [Coprobacillus sp.]|nr:transposase [Coprobacillus sp.]